MNHDHAPLDAALVALARRAATASGDLLRQNFGQAELLSQQGRDIKLGEDHRAQQLIVETIRSGSDLPILTEEAGWIGEPPPGEGLYWVVDPLDGSFNYRTGTPLCGTAVALCAGLTPLAGCIHDFLRDALYWGGPGIGLYCNDDPLGDLPQPHGILATGFPVGGDFSDQGIAAIVRQISDYKKVRMIGSAALSLAWVASGRFDAYAESGIRWWDVAAGLALVAATGGRVAIAGESPDGTFEIFASRHPE
ncbi:inositol monophosphatase family protein [Parasphingopyxis marina]|uniref:Inositol monophosphatase family protein n=1 Tax=Parasphingopyxis marina TaxID=2761622 RepID=A0A842HUH8_9SPHN|nr:inositol monophosphatase family protein [Parasphingopyxis marina]MBC2776041.1 inositol monophosphatase family protein [Parasphingopyxis marina]